MGGLEPIH